MFNDLHVLRGFEGLDRRPHCRRGRLTRRLSRQARVFADLSKLLLFLPDLLLRGVLLIAEFAELFRFRAAGFGRGP
jgi:hypothetical protein